MSNIPPNLPETSGYNEARGGDNHNGFVFDGLFPTPYREGQTWIYNFRRRTIYKRGGPIGFNTRTPIFRNPSLTSSSSYQSRGFGANEEMGTLQYQLNDWKKGAEKKLDKIPSYKGNEKVDNWLSSLAKYGGEDEGENGGGNVGGVGCRSRGCNCKIC